MTGPAIPSIRPSLRSSIAVGVILVAVLVLLSAGGLFGAGSPDDSSPEAGFARDMQTHHAQAVRMAMIVRDRTTDTGTRTLAYDIALTQQYQIWQMAAWLEGWELPQTARSPPMAWAAGHTDHDRAPTTRAAARMPGMATPDQLEQLEAAKDRTAEVLFLRLMITHHQAGVRMAQAALALSGDPAVRSLAGKIVAAQTSEMNAMRQMLATRNAMPGTVYSPPDDGAAPA